MPLVLAAPPIGELIGIAFLVISFLSWIFSVINGVKGQQGGPAPRAPRPKPEIRNEIEAFLEELVKPAAPQKPVKPPKPKAERPKQEKQKQKSKAKPLVAVDEDRPGPRVSERHLAAPKVVTKGLGAGVREHVATHLADNRVTAEAQVHAGHRVSTAVQQDLGGGMAASAPSTSFRAEDHPLAALLRSPAGVRQAILLQEILQRPKSLRR